MRLHVWIGILALAYGVSVPLLAAESIVHMLVPGFTVQELPVKLNNLNNLRFAPDGRLTALAYDGRIWRLRDTNGDGLEDIAEPYWDQPTLSVPVGIAWSAAGLYVSSHGKVSLLRDTDGDGKADVEEVIASGWPATDVGSGGVDATAVALDKEGNVYFGLLVADYSNAYRLRQRKDLKPEEAAWLAKRAANDSPSPAKRSEVGEGRGEGLDPNEEVSLYDLNSQRGTIQKWNVRTRKLETIATGIRVPYTLAFNQSGDLFNTDQEGETWMPNGNPLDELNHIIPGRNYGFPPRHEKWLPNLVSEPPVVAFGPQHESTCGLVFNEPHGPLNSKLKTQNSKLPALPAAPSQALFGPKWWRGDAFIAGESRGKIWRVRLVKTPHGYVGKEYLIARLSMLTTDLAISPRGELYVSCHSGGPDWGTGPNGPGKIFKISYTDPKAPQPVIAWAASPTEVRVAFDKPLDPSVTNAVLWNAPAQAASGATKTRSLTANDPEALSALTPALSPRRGGNEVSVSKSSSFPASSSATKAIVTSANAAPPSPANGYKDSPTSQAKVEGRTGGATFAGDEILTGRKISTAGPPALPLLGERAGVRASQDPERAETRATIEFGEYVRAADRYEVLKPPYRVVQQQEATPRGKLRILSAQLSDDGQTLMLTTEPHPAAVNYALTIPNVKAERMRGEGETVDVDYDFSGIRRFVRHTKPRSHDPPPNGSPRPLYLDYFMGIDFNWFPSYNPKVSRNFVNSAPYFREVVHKILDAKVSRSTTDFRPRLPSGKATLHFTADRGFDLIFGERPRQTRLSALRSGAGEFEINLRTASLNSVNTVEVRAPAGMARYSLTYSTESDPTERPLSLAYCLVPWAPTNQISNAVSLKTDFAVGDWQHGRDLFFSEPVQCAKCHRVRGEGATVGPDLSNLIFRDAVNVLRDIREPSAAINPDYVTYNVTRTDGESLIGFIRANERDALRVIGADGKEIVVPRAELKDFAPSAVSLMPSGLLDALKESEVKDLLTFLLYAPPVRTTDELRSAGILPAAAQSVPNVSDDAARLDRAPVAAARMAALRIVLVASKQDHGPGQHDYPAWQKKWSGLLASAGTNVAVTEAWEWPAPEQWQTADVVVFYFWNHDWSAERYRQFDGFLARGGGVVLLHSATIADQDPEQLAERIGLAAQPQRTKYSHCPLDLKIAAEDGNPITRGLPKQIAFIDEPYWPMIGDAKNVEVLATTEQDGQSWPMMWTIRKGKGRVFASILGHYTWTHDDPLFRLLILRGISWAAGAEPERLVNAHSLVDGK